jgi:hypothetical protein
MGSVYGAKAFTLTAAIIVGATTKVIGNTSSFYVCLPTAVIDIYYLYTASTNNYGIEII